MQVALEHLATVAGLSLAYFHFRTPLDFEHWIFAGFQSGLNPVDSSHTGTGFNSLEYQYD